MNQELKSSVRPYDLQFQSKQNGTGKPEHYRINLFSDHKTSGTLSDATYHIHNNLFPNNRTDLMNGEWEVFLETFTGNFQTRVDPYDVGLKICLPDLCHSSQNYMATRTANFRSVFQVDDSVAFIPIPFQYATPVDAFDVVETTTLQTLPIRYNRSVNVNEIGVKVDMRALMTGVLRVVIKDGDGNPALRNPLEEDVGAAGVREMWYATLLFVHKP